LLRLLHADLDVSLVACALTLHGSVLFTELWVNKWCCPPLESGLLSVAESDQIDEAQYDLKYNEKDIYHVHCLLMRILVLAGVWHDHKSETEKK